MPTLVNAASRLIQQVQELNPKSAVRALGPADGYNRLRALEFDARTSKWLVPALEAINDERIASVDTAKSRAVVHFVGDTRADKRDDYPLAEVLAVLRGEG